MQDHQANVKKDDCVYISSLSFDIIPESALMNLVTNYSCSFLTHLKKKTFSNCPQCGRFPDLFPLILPIDK